jgi:hypothetical protein
MLNIILYNIDIDIDTSTINAGVVYWSFVHQLELKHHLFGGLTSHAGSSHKQSGDHWDIFLGYPLVI